MSFHIVNVNSAKCLLTCSNGQLRQVSEDGEHSLPIEDVAAILITSFSATINTELLKQCAKYGISFIICEAFKPVSLMLPANRSTDTLLSRAVLNLEDKTRDRLWQRCIDAKCANQAALAKHLLPTNPSTAKLVSCSIGNRQNKESVCARWYWQVIGRVSGNDKFIRGRDKGGINCLLNFGYSIVLSVVLQKLFALGLDPTFGISHALRERATPLAYDLMEPFRPCVDARVVQWLHKRSDRQEAVNVTKEFRQWITAVTTEHLEFDGRSISLQGCVEATTRDFRRAVLEGDARFYKPWTLKNSKWAG